MYNCLCMVSCLCCGLCVVRVVCWMLSVGCYILGFVFLVSSVLFVVCSLRRMFVCSVWWFACRVRFVMRCVQCLLCSRVVCRVSCVVLSLLGVGCCVFRKWGCVMCRDVCVESWVLVLVSGVSTKTTQQTTHTHIAQGTRQAHRKNGTRHTTQCTPHITHHTRHTTQNTHHERLHNNTHQSAPNTTRTTQHTQDSTTPRT